MIDPRALFRRNVARVEDDSRIASAALVARLKRLTPVELLRQPHSAFADLTLTQYREVVAVVAPDVAATLPPDDEAESPSLLDRWREFWARRSAFMRACILTVASSVLGTLAIVILGPVVLWNLAPYTLQRPIAVETWPRCGRLAWDVDGCIYVPHRDLAWLEVAAATRIDVNSLQRTNRHLPYAMIPAGSTLIIWRGRGRFQETMQ